VAASLVADAKIMAGLAPLGAVRSDAAASDTELRQQVCQLVAKGALDLCGIMFAQPRIQGDELAARIGSPGRAEKAGVPFDAELACQFVGLEPAQDLLGFRFEGKIAAQQHERGAGGKDEVELFRRLHRFRRLLSIASRRSAP
jgi:hypothetical protein